MSRRANDARQLDLLIFCEGLPLYADPRADLAARPADIIPRALPIDDAPEDWPEGAVRPEHPVHRTDNRPYWKTAAWAWGGEILASRDCPPPIELTVRGVRTVAAFGFGMATHAVDPPGTPYWSDTGFRSFTGYNGPADPDVIREYLEGYIDAPTKDGNGCGGKLTPWWTCTIRQLQQERHWAVTIPDRPVGKERLASLEEQVRAEGYDPDVVAPWPAKARQRELV